MQSSQRPDAFSRFQRATLSLAAIALARLGLRALPIPVLARMLGVRLGTARGAPSPAQAWADLPRELALTLGSLDAMLHRWPGRAPCLVRSLAAGYLLNDRHPTLRIGVAGAPAHAPWTAHAWLEVAGVSLPEPRRNPTTLDGLRALGKT